MPGGAIRNAIFRRSAASAISGVESLLKSERDCSFTHPEDHGIEERKLEIGREMKRDALLLSLIGYEARYGSGTDRADGRAN